MRKFHQFTQIALLIFFAAFLIFFMAFETLGGIFGMDEITSDGLVKILLVGFLLFLLSWIVSYLALKGQKDLLAKKEVEMNKIKAKLYDLENPDSSPKNKEAKPTDSENSGIKPRQNFTE
ncbi:hypothetical protein [Algoriphagus sp.]|uniref:hypothetical protein n=1 Tax=Algoriphagus sp. TaxID=1872435 RepID=UPI0025D4B3C5|nr:hypothetical protein [Algoriphagus sp.]